LPDPASPAILDPFRKSPAKDAALPLVVHSHPHWTELVLDEPPRNVLHASLLEDAAAHLRDLAAGEAPLLLIGSRGKHFSTGYPIGEIPEAIFHRDPRVRAAHPFEQVMDLLSAYPSPIVARVQGDAWGGAVELLACADIRIATDRVRVALPPVRLGLIYSHTGLRRLIRALGSPLVREMLLTGEPVGAARASGTGFFSRVVAPEDLDATVTGVMESLARGGPSALRGTRRILNLLEDHETLPAAVLAEIADLRHESWTGEEFRRAQAAFLAGEPSPFPPRSAAD